jgi:hypothetical protein
MIMRYPSIINQKNYCICFVSVMDSIESTFELNDREKI